MSSIYENKAFLIHKPLHWTSFDAVKKMRHLLKVKKIGHAGTLDPLATGLLILCTGQKTKTLSAYQRLPKTYEGTIGLGKTTPSFDRGTPFSSTQSCGHLTAQAIQEATETFVGTLLQTPPIYSAVKVQGQRAYTLARQGKVPKLAPREATVHEFVITHLALPYLHFRIVCSRGTYIRSIAHDLGERLAVGGYLERLVRTAIGPYTLANGFLPTEPIAHIAPSIIG